MKTKIFKTLVLCMMISLALPAVSLANTTVAPIESKDDQAQRLNQRLEEIRDMDTKSISKKEKRMLRAEVRTIKKELAAISGGVYLSIGAILLIALLLILLL
jgi:hypothetical protein